MSKQKDANIKRGYGLGTVLFFIFLTLKLTGFITWSWWWVTAPIWIPLGLICIILLIALIGMILTKE